MNPLYPIFLKTKQLHFLVVGGGNVAEEKLSFLLKSSPESKVTVVSPMFRPPVREIAERFDVTLIEDVYAPHYLDNKHIVIATTDKPEVNRQVHTDARARYLLVNVADTPELCDFYLGGIVTKGNLKIAFSTNGKSPTLAKRLRQFFEAVIPEDVNKLLDNLYQYRSTLKLTFEEKVDKMNEVTTALVEDQVGEKDKD